jgi:hypothetical protein
MGSKNKVPQTTYDPPTGANLIFARRPTMSVRYQIVYIYAPIFTGKNKALGGRMGSYTGLTVNPIAYSKCDKL